MRGTEDETTFTLADLIREQARARPDHIAYVYGERRLSCAGVDERSSRAANALRAAGVGPGDRVGFLSANRPEFYEVAFGASKLDAVVIALNWRLAPAELAAIVADAEPAVLIVEPELEHLLPEATGVPVVRLGDDYERLLAGASPEDPHTPSAPDHAVLTLYSSGTTGRPKGVQITNEGLSYSERMSRENYRMHPGTVNIVVAPLFHIGGAGWGLMAMFHGATCVIMRDAEPEGVLETIERERVTHAFFVPAVIQSLVEAPSAGTRDLSSLEQIAYGAAPMNETLLRRALQTLGCDFLGVYGMTETSGTVVALQPSDHETEGPRTSLLRSVGRPVDWVELRVADLDSGEEAPPGTVGEIQVRARQNMMGYWRQPETTAETVLPDGWLRTGDGAYRDEEGFVFLQDRIKDMIISGGENIYPAEVENALAEHPAVAQVAVIGVPHPRWTETPKAVVVLRDGAEATPEELIAFSRERLAHYKCPTSVDFASELPRNPSGKLLKKILREQYAGEEA